MVEINVDKSRILMIFDKTSIVDDLTYGYLQLLLCIST
jgi:hypothetical protein